MSRKKKSDGLNIFTLYPSKQKPNKAGGDYYYFFGTFSLFPILEI